MELRADAKRNLVIIDGHEVLGSLDPDRCSVCGTTLVFHQQWDASFCPLCNLWVDEACDGEDCEFCTKRPTQPLPTRPTA